MALSGSGTDLRVYLDGILAGRDAVGTVHYGSSSSGFNIGGGGILDGMDTSFDGWVDEVAVFDRTLMDEEICRLYRLAIQAPLRLRIARGPVVGGGGQSAFGLVLSWPCGVLQQADGLRNDGRPNTWWDVPAAASPFTVSSGSAARFYRIRE